ncbi:hypothetical protein [Vibrio harveyi]|uniref:hypothetical protein n=1 Tax=Vibrio harveyi group TaxID=717610 RepID=UPI00237FF4BD|nr:hypothetical protein [Vibrio harveyi]
MAVEVNPNNKVFRKDELLARYCMFSAESGKPITDRTLQKWRKEKGYPEPIASRPRVVFLREDVLAWELEKGWDSFLDGHGEIDDEHNAEE